MTVATKAKANPILTVAIFVGVLAGGVAGAVQIWNVLDKTHVTEAELLIYHQPFIEAHLLASEHARDLSLKIDKIEITGKCRWLLSQIRALEDSIYVRERDGADPDYINELKQDLTDLNRDYTALKCALKLA